MDKRTIILDANDISTGFDLATKISNDIFGLNINLGNIDALFDSISDYFNGMRIVVNNAEKLPSDARRVLDDALENSTGLEVLFEYGDGRIKRQSSTGPVNVNICFTNVGTTTGKKKNWWNDFYAKLVKFCLWMAVLGLVIVSVVLVCRYFGGTM